MSTREELLRSIDWLVGEMDKDTRYYGADYPLRLYGASGSRYLNAIEAKAGKLGLKVFRETEAPEVCPPGPVVADLETVKNAPRIPFTTWDLDGVDQGEVSCTSLAVHQIIRDLPYIYPDVCIIGRGHAVKGLANLLLDDNATVTICHSLTCDLRRFTDGMDVIVNSAPKLEAFYDVSPSGSVLIDISGGLAGCRDMPDVTYIGPETVGRLNISFLLNRFVHA